MDSSHHSPWSKMMRDITMLQVRLSFISRDFNRAQTDFICRIFFEGNINYRGWIELTTQLLGFVCVFGTLIG